jgi:N-acetylglucosamine kinase-like BadF-type ATPase
LGSKVRIRFKVDVIENACLVARAVDLMTNDRFIEGYSLIRDMQANDFLIALRIRAEHGVMIKKLCDFKERHKTTETESIAAMLTRAAERGDEEAISLLAAGALERCV